MDLRVGTSKGRMADLPLRTSLETNQTLDWFGLNVMPARWNNH